MFLAYKISKPLGVGEGGWGGGGGGYWGISLDESASY